MSLYQDNMDRSRFIARGTPTENGRCNVRVYFMTGHKASNSGEKSGKLLFAGMTVVPLSLLDERNKRNAVIGYTLREDLEEPSNGIKVKARVSSRRKKIESSAAIKTT